MGRRFGRSVPFPGRRILGGFDERIPRPAAPTQPVVIRLDSQAGKEILSHTTGK